MGRPSKAEQQRRRAAGQPVYSQFKPTGGLRHPVDQAAEASADSVKASVDLQVPVDHTGQPMFDPLLTVDHLSLWLGKPRGTLYQWRNRGMGPRAIKVGHDLRYRRSDVEAWLEDQADQRDSA